MGEEFTKVVGDLDRGKSYVYQAYVKNELGMGIGQMKWIREYQESDLPEILLGAEALEGGWYTSWMGDFWMGDERKWLYHLSLGWIFLFRRRAGGSMDLAGARWVAMDDTRCVAVPLESAKY